MAELSKAVDGMELLGHAGCQPWEGFPSCSDIATCRLGPHWRKLAGSPSFHVR